MAEGDTAVTRASGLPEREWIEVTTGTEPREVLIDPLVLSHDWNMLNNRWERLPAPAAGGARLPAPRSTSIRTSPPASGGTG